MILKISARCSDKCSIAAFDKKGEIARQDDGYVPYGLGIGGGSYITLDIDLETGKILNFPKELTKEEIRRKINH